MAYLQSPQKRYIEILSNLYADDLSCRAVSAAKAFEKYQQAKEIMLRGGLNLRKWNSNDTGLLERINAIEKTGQNSTKDTRTVSQVVEDDESYSKFPVCQGGESAWSYLGQ